MLKTLLESFIIECLEENRDINEEINYIYQTLDNNFITTFQKTIKESGVNIHKLKMMAWQVLNDEEFNQELEELFIEKPCNPLVEVYDQVVYSLMCKDRNATYDEILADNDGDYIKSIHELIDCLNTCIDEEDEDIEFYQSLKDKILKIL